MGSDDKQVDRVNRINRAFTVIFTEAMQSIKPLKDIKKLRRAKGEEEKKVKQQIVNDTYDVQIKQWQDAFAFDAALRKYVNKLSNVIVLAGGRNSSKGANSFTKESLEKLEELINSKSDDKTKSTFEVYMESCRPTFVDDPEEKMKAWNDAFDFPKKLYTFLEDLKELVKNGKEIKPDAYLSLVDDFIKKLKVDEDEFFIKATHDVAGDAYKIDSETIKIRGDAKIEELVTKITAKTSKEIPKVYKKNFIDNTETFKKIMRGAKKNELEVKAEKKIIEKKYDKAKFNFEIDEELVKAGAQAVKKMFPQYMNYIAIGSIAVILGLVILSVTCWTCYNDTISAGEINTVETIKTTTINETTISTTTTQVIDATEGDATEESISGIVFRNPATEILESNMMMVLVSTFVAPMATRILKEKFDIDITEKQVGMLMGDGISSVAMYAKEADKLRDANGKIPKKYQKTLRDKAFNALRENYTADKYTDLVAGVGAQVFDKAIESAVKSGRLERFPLEKKQVEELIKQSIDAVPQIVEWQKLNEEVKNTFIDGNIRKLLQNIGVNGWSYKALENVFDGEMSKRIVGAVLVLKDSVFKQIDSNEPYLKYTSTIIDAALEREKPKTVTVTTGVQS